MAPLLVPLALVFVTAVLVFVCDLVQEGTNASPSWSLRISTAGLFLALCFLLSQGPTSSTAFAGRIALDTVGWWFTLILLLGAFFGVLLASDFLNSNPKSKTAHLSAAGEYCTLLLFNLLGMLSLVVARDIVLFFVSLELATLPLFLLAAWQKSSTSAEAGLKYVLLGALSSALLVYGLSLLYGITGETAYSAIAVSASTSALFSLSASLILAGVGFKLALVPCHSWAPDVYQGAPTPVTAYLSVNSKAIGVLLVCIVFQNGFVPAFNNWDTLFAIVAALTMTLGNLGAIGQRDIKRLMAYSSISQAGYLLLGFLGTSAHGISSLLYYLLAYVVTNLAVFAGIVYVEKLSGKTTLEAFRGLSKRNSLAALGMMVALFGLAGIPPLSGFVGKFFLFSVAAEANYYWLVLLAAVNSTVSLYYYLRIVRQMYIEDSEPDIETVPMSYALGSTLLLTAVASVVLGVCPHFFQTIENSLRTSLASSYAERTINSGFIHKR